MSFTYFRVYYIYVYLLYSSTRLCRGKKVIVSQGKLLVRTLSEGKTSFHHFLKDGMYSEIILC